MSRTRMTMFVAMMAVLLLLAIAPAGEAAQAAGEPGATAPSTLAPHYSEEADPNLGYLFAVYMVTWAGFFGYVFWISRRQRALGREIEYLTKLLSIRNEEENPEADANG